MKTYLITGGAGFIGSNYIRHLLKQNTKIKIINLDKLTYCGNLDNLKDIENDTRYTFIQGDIADKTTVTNAFKHKPDILINFAAETHVDRSINQPDDFIKTDIYGTYTLLETARTHGLELFIQISTDEVYGPVLEGEVTEEAPLKPSNPYSASKVGADRLCYSYYITYKIPILIDRASNNFGPFQYPEKIIPLFVTNALQDQQLPIYGNGLQVRDWLFVEDHCRAIDILIHKGQLGEVYNVGGNHQITNIELTKQLLQNLNKPESLINHITDRPGHDRRYSLNSDKIKQLGWQPQTDFHTALTNTINWYQNNPSWWQKIKSGKFKEYYKKQYTK